MSNVELLWRDFFADPSQWWDRRKRKTNLNAPDFKHKKTRQSLWIDRPDSPGWVKLMLAQKGKGDQQGDLDTIQTKGSMWEDYFMDPTMWWDNRRTKKNPRAPDFKHKVTKQTLWLDDSSNPQWVALKFQMALEKQTIASEVNLLMGITNLSACSLSRESEERESEKSSIDSFSIELNVGEPKVQEIIDWESLSADQAVSLLEQQPKPPSVDILASILLKCRRKKSLLYAKRAYAYICKNNVKSHSRLGNYLVPMFVDCGGLHDAQQVFDSLIHRSEFSWSSLIYGYCECGDFQQALSLYKGMQEYRVHPSPHTFLSLLKACIKLNCAERGKEMHKWIVALGYEQEGPIGNILVDMYVKFGSLAEAQEVLLGLCIRDVVAWTALIAGYAVLGLAEEVSNCLEGMRSEGVSPDPAAHVCSLKAFSNAGAIDYGRDVHSQVIMGGFEEDVLISNALVDMYAKCGSLMEAWGVFNKIPTQGVVSWTAIIAGHARQGECEMVFELFDEMRRHGVRPNDATFLIVLSVCSHAGMVEMGLLYFELMKNEYGMMPTVDHHNCMLDLLSRSGQLNAAMLMLENMPVAPNLVSWKTILSACRKWGTLDIAKQAYELAVQKDMDHPSVLALMCNVFSDPNMWRELKNLEKKQTGIQGGEELGKSWIEIVGDMHACMKEGPGLYEQDLSPSGKQLAELHWPKSDFLNTV